MIANTIRLLLAIQALSITSLVAWLLIPHPYPAWPAVVVCLGILLATRLMPLLGLALALRQQMCSPDRVTSQALRTLCMEAWCSIATFNWHMGVHTFDKVVFSDTRTPPVLLLHGFGCNSGIWHWLSRSLCTANVTHYAIDMEPVFGDIETYVPQIDATIRQMQQETGHDKIIIVAHSMGGIAARAYICTHGTDAIQHVITIGSPHHGTRLARLGYGQNVRQMRYGQTIHDWLPQLARTETLAIRSLFTSIRSQHDNIVTPSSSSLLEGASNITYCNLGHVALLRSPIVHETILREIKLAGLKAAGDSKQATD